MTISSQDNKRTKEAALSTLNAANSLSDAADRLEMAGNALSSLYDRHTHVSDLIPGGPRKPITFEPRTFSDTPSKIPALEKKLLDNMKPSNLKSFVCKTYDFKKIEVIDSKNYYANNTSAKTVQELCINGKSNYTLLQLKADDFSICKKEADGSSKQLNLPKDLREKILKVIPKIDKKQWDCASFTNAVNPNPNQVPHYFPKEHIARHLHEGDVIAMGITKCTLTPGFRHYDANHWAMYIGNELYLSKLGPGGDLCITSLDELMNIFPADTVAIVQRWDQL